MGAGKGRNRRVMSAAAAMYRAAAPTPAVNENATIFGMAGNRASLHNHLMFPNLDFDPNVHTQESGLPVTKPDYWKDSLEAFQHPGSGLSVRIPPRMPSNTGSFESEANPGYDLEKMVVWGDVMREGRPVGNLKITVSPDQKGDFEMRINSVELRYYPPTETKEDHDYTRTGNGFGSALVNELKHIAREGGAKRVTLNAVGGGSYFWQRQGFDLDVREYYHEAGSSLEQVEAKSAEIVAEKVVERMKSMVKDEFWAPLERARIGAALEKFQDGLVRSEARSLRDLVALLDGGEVAHPRTGRQQPLAAAVFDKITWDGVCFL